jgi:uncharacterized protein YdcH (DUF465 family)
MNEKVKNTTKETDYLEEAEAHFDSWQDDLNQMEDTVKSANSEFDTEYQKQIATLKGYLQDFGEQINGLKLADPGQWEAQMLKVEDSARKYHDAYGEAMRLMKETERESAGWLEGFSDHPPSGSAGWLEGFHTRAKGSEGWVEGMAHRTSKSKGWTEGYGDEQ